MGRNHSAPAFAVLMLTLGLAGPNAASGEGPGISPRIVNGLLTSDFPTTGALLMGSDPESAISWCSGTMIGCETFLTAAHCFCLLECGDSDDMLDPGDFTVYLQHAGFLAVESISIRSDFAFPVADVAVLKLANPVDGIAPSRINTTIDTTGSSDWGTPGTIAGFGRSGGSLTDYGLLRFGSVVTGDCSNAGVSDNTSLCWTFEEPIGPPGMDSTTCNADSGGPLFIDSGTEDVVAGVTSGGNADCEPTDHAYDADVFFYSGWIQSQGGSDLDNASCGALPQVGGPEVQVDTFSGQLSPASNEGRHSFVVPDDTSELRVTMNAHDDSTTNFDLYVKQGSPPTTSDYDCRQTGSGQFGVCEFVWPVDGPWHVLVRRLAGTGLYQATATAFAQPPECDDGVDNDGDGRVDFDPVTFNDPDFTAGSGDPGCKRATWPTESPECQDGMDNDAQTGTDFDGGASLDLDGNGFVDPEFNPSEPAITEPDPQCVAKPWRNIERKISCGFGFEVALLLAGLMWMHRRRRLN